MGSAVSNLEIRAASGRHFSLLIDLPSTVIFEVFTELIIC